MRSNLKLVGGTSTGTAFPKTFDENRASSTGSGEIRISDILRGPDVVGGRASAEDWREIAEYNAQSKRVKSLFRILAIFNAAVLQWKEETKYSSSMTSILLHPSYQRVIGLGPEVVPFVLKDLAETGAHWAWALQALTGENPVPEQSEGRPRLMAQAWVSWGKERDLI